MFDIVNEKKAPWLKRPSIRRLKKVDAYTPYQKLQKTLQSQTFANKETNQVLYWFRNKDLRIEDNKALYYASKKAKEAKKPLIALYVYSKDSLIQHGISTAQMDFILETLKGVQASLNQLNIPLVILTADQLSDTESVLLPFLKKQGISDVYANYEYEVNELKRDERLIRKIGSKVNCFYYHDQCMFEPGYLTNKQNKPMQVFTRYYELWLKKIAQFSSDFKVYPAPFQQSSDYRKQLTDLFDNALFQIPDSKRFSSTKEKEALHKIWPAGHKAALKKLNYFVRHHLKDYAVTRDQPALESTSKMSAYLAVGAISVRTILAKMIKHNKNSFNFSKACSESGLVAWVREIVFREFYRDRLAMVPHISMNFPQNYKFAQVNWENDKTGWEKWCAGQTGIPWIDAGMRQLKQEAYMHNRLRMNVAFYLYGVLLIDYRLGERYFSEMLVDYDLANNVQGWSPSYTPFNPILQAEKCDAKGNYIRKWVPELRHLRGRTIFDPYHRLPLKEFEKLGYPKPYMDWKISKNRYRERFKAAMRERTDA